MPLITPFPLQRALMKRERSSGLYRTSSFYLAKVILEIPLAIAQRLLFYTVLYFMCVRHQISSPPLTRRVGLRLDARAFFIYLAVNCVQVTNSIGEHSRPPHWLRACRARKAHTSSGSRRRRREPHDRHRQCYRACESGLILSGGA